MSWKDKEVEKFKVEWQNNPKAPVLLRTPAMDYGLTVDDFKKVRARINDFELKKKGEV